MTEKGTTRIESPLTAHTLAEAIGLRSGELQDVGVPATAVLDRPPRYSMTLNVKGERY